MPRSRAHVPARSHVGAGCWCWFPSTPHALLPGAWATLSLPPRAGAMGPGVSGLGVFIQLHRGPSEPLHSLACRRSQRRDVYKSVSGVNETRRDVSHLLRVRHVPGPACPRCWHTPAQRPEGQGRLLMWGARAQRASDLPPASWPGEAATAVDKSPQPVWPLFSWAGDIYAQTRPRASFGLEGSAGLLGVECLPS